MFGFLFPLGAQLNRPLFGRELPDINSPVAVRFRRRRNFILIETIFEK